MSSVLQILGGGSTLSINDCGTDARSRRNSFRGRLNTAEAVKEETPEDSGVSSVAVPIINRGFVPDEDVELGSGLRARVQNVQ
jgi:hypothetical protein